MKEQFEKLPEIARRLYQLEFRPDINAYLAKPEYCNRYVNFVNGALYAYQEQQKKLNDIRDYILLNQVEGEDSEFTGKVINLIETDKLLGLLK